MGDADGKTGSGPPRIDRPAAILRESRCARVRSASTRETLSAQAAPVKQTRTIVVGTMGFTLLELMVVVAVLAILALTTSALPDAQ
jgi:prepilin-type N-terminal cleavage/methylation domain-containing protein